MSPLIIEHLDLEHPEFRKSYLALPSRVVKDARLAMGLLVLADLMHPPAKLNLHHLEGKVVTSRTNSKKRFKVYVMNLNQEDSYKATFTFERGVAFMRTCGPHGKVNQQP